MFLSNTEFPIIDINTQCEGKGGGRHEKKFFIYVERTYRCGSEQLEFCKGEAIADLF